MPYARNADLPDAVKNALPAEAQSIFRHAFNSAVAKGLSEERAFKVGWGAVKNAGYKKTDGGKYQKVEKFNKSDQHCDIIKVDETENIVYGWGMVSTMDGEAYFDSGPIDKDTGEHTPEHIPEPVMRKAATDFMLADATPNIDMHMQDEFGIKKNAAILEPGKVVHSFPLTAEIAKAFGITCNKTGWLVGVRPPAGSLALFKQGVYKGFSIGGSGTKIEVTEDSGE